MSKRNKFKKKYQSLLLENQTDEALIELAHTLHTAITAKDTFSAYDMVLEEAIKRELERRGFKILDNLTIEASVYEPTDGVNNQVKGSDVGEKPSKGKKEKKSKKTDLEEQRTAAQQLQDYWDTCPDM